MARLRVSVGGVIATVGKWSNTYEFLLGAAVPDQNTLQTIANACVTNLSASTALKAALCSDTSVAEVKLLAYASNTGPASFVATGNGAPFIGTLSPVHAPQVAAVASLRTGGAGRSYRGRVFIPYRGSGISPAGALTSTTPTTVGQAAVAVRTAIVSAAATSGVSAIWVVWSPKLGTGSPVTAVLVGNQCDTIRHRNDNRDETYTAVTVPSAVEVQPNSDQEQQNAQDAGLHLVSFTGPSGEPNIGQALLDVLPYPEP